jgi:Lon protease-like protein
MCLPDQSISSTLLPIFALPNVVLFPRAILPLHIFEERYKAMTADALAGNKLVAMALLKPGWEKAYYSRPDIEPVVCVGTILSSERLADGKYNFLLQGVARARVVRESAGKLYRRAELAHIEQTQVLELDLADQRRRLVELFSESALSTTPLGKQFRQMLTSPLPTADILDIAAFNLLDDVRLKQSLLADGNIRARIDRAIDAIESLQRTLASTPRPREQNWN